MTTAKTIYPSYGDYNLSVSHLPKFAREPRLVQAQPQKIANGNLVAYSGGYSRVYPVQSGSGKYALRCWTADVGDARERYRQIGTYLARQSMPYFVEFEYLENAIVVKGQHYPVLWMEWAEGPRLREFIGQNLGNRPVLRQLARAFREMVAALHAAQISHGDLQDENIIVQNGPAGPRLKLIDYDSLYVPALQGYSDQIIGVSHYQHPRRDSLRTASDRVDYFSELVIYLSLLVYEQNSTLWNPHAEKQLLFADSDYVDPVRSKAFQDLQYMTGEVRVLTDRLMQFCREGDLLRLEPLEVVTAGMNGGGSAPSTSAQTGGLPSGFLNTPLVPGPPVPATPTIAVPDDMLRTPTRPGPCSVPAPAVNVPDDLLTTPTRPRPGPAAPAVNVPGDLLTPPAAPPQSAPPAPVSIPSGFLHAHQGSQFGAPATRGTTSGASGSWDAFFEGALRTATSQPNTTVLTRPAPPAQPGPTPAFAPPPSQQRPARRTAPPAPTSSAGPAAKPVDWRTVGRGFAFGIIAFLVILLVVLLLIRAGGMAVLGAETGGFPPMALAGLPGPSGAPRVA